MLVIQQQQQQHPTSNITFRLLLKVFFLGIVFKELGREDDAEAIHNLGIELEVGNNTNINNKNNDYRNNNKNNDYRNNNKKKNKKNEEEEEE